MERKEICLTWILSRVWVTVDGVLNGDRIYWALQHTSRDYTLQTTVLHTSQLTIGHARSFQFLIVFIRRCLVPASNGWHYPSSGFTNGPWSQLPASHSYSSRQLNPVGYLTITHQPTHPTPLTPYWLVLLMTSQHGPQRKHRPSVSVSFLLSCFLGCPHDRYSAIT
jgi:hypothetical protein